MISTASPALHSFVLSAGFGFPKASRLLKSRDFQFRPYLRFQTDLFRFVYTPKGSGRLGISLSRKVLRRAVARNRVRRLLKEAFRLRPGQFEGFDLHVIGQPILKEKWASLTLQDIGGELDRVKERFHQ